MSDAVKKKGSISHFRASVVLQVLLFQSCSLQKLGIDKTSWLLIFLKKIYEQLFLFSTYKPYYFISPRICLESNHTVTGKSLNGIFILPFSLQIKCTMYLIFTESVF